VRRADPPPASLLLLFVAQAKGNSTQVSAIKAYREKIEKELADSASLVCLSSRSLGQLADPDLPPAVCEDILSVLEKHLIPSAESGESKVRSLSLVLLLASSP